MSQPTTLDEYRLPRDPSRYEPTTHFLDRIKYRKDPEPSSEIAREVIEEGTITPVEPMVVYIDHELPSQSLARESDNWRLVVDVNPEAFHDETETHTLVTIYASNVHEADHQDMAAAH